MPLHESMEYTREREMNEDNRAFPKILIIANSVKLDKDLF